ncbi:hypothetical protein CY34DRAFT_381843 [Suillus luteus UH-Slu-Lm8-n1]|uniref:Unplaced genomic scaffold CY34scaffold_250, whole genome shotgun sequence n=1 Tax=Suillus luteus UH-Slu-Lm8-n1 TaxID=930992 RepID=A0A0D0B451_9AGAM|nr:hypothetical protein CY34DRAFT_381843 [Suillus luteus UH-Slu-Lm8-n1]
MYPISGILQLALFDSNPNSQFKATSTVPPRPAYDRSHNQCPPSDYTADKSCFCQHGTSAAVKRYNFATVPWVTMVRSKIDNTVSCKSLTSCAARQVSIRKRG